MAQPFGDGAGEHQQQRVQQLPVPRVQLSSVDDMLPDSLRGYAPVVRGVAATNARVEIRQNGYVIYSTNVAPGPFEIHDVYPHTNNGDLQVTVNEADGSHKTFSVAYSSSQHAARRHLNFQLTAGTTPAATAISRS